jgi:Family of unknown function (DUF6220)
MRATYRVLALLIAVGVVVQAASIAVAWFTVLHDTDSGSVFDKNAQPNWGHMTHTVVGSGIIPILAILLLIISFFAKIPGGVRWAAITFGVVALQFLFAVLAFSAPVVGALHGINAFVLAAVASLAARQARVAEKAPPVEAASPVATV